MTDIDTAAIRASVSGRCDAVAENLVDVCDALDAARADLKWMTEHRDERTDRLFAANQRAESAEAELAATHRERERLIGAANFHALEENAAKARIAELEAQWTVGECCPACPCHGYEDSHTEMLQARIAAALAEIRDHAYIDWENVERALTGGNR